MESSAIFKKDGAQIFDFALKYIYADRIAASQAPELSEEVRVQKKLEMAQLFKEVTSAALEKSQGNYHNMLEIIGLLVEANARAGGSGVSAQRAEPVAIVEKYQTQAEIHKQCIKSLIRKIGATSSILLLQHL